MEAPTIAEQAQIVTMSVGSIITIATSIVVVLTGAIGVLFKIFLAEKKKDTDAIIQLTRSYIESNAAIKIAVEGSKTAIDNNTKVIEKLPEQIILQINAKK